jgi:hypothetical protein
VGVHKPALPPQQVRPREHEGRAATLRVTVNSTFGLSPDVSKRVSRNLPSWMRINHPERASSVVAVFFAGVLVAFDARRLLGREGEELVVGAAEAADVEGKRQWPQEGCSGGGYTLF